MRQPGLQSAIDPELYQSLIVFERSHGSTSVPYNTVCFQVIFPCFNRQGGHPKFNHGDIRSC